MSKVLPVAGQSPGQSQTINNRAPMPRNGWPRLRIVNTDERFRPSPRPPCRKLMGVRILGSGSYVPDCVITNETVGRTLRIDPERIVRQTGIHERRQAHPTQATSDLAVEASRRAMASAGVRKTDIDLIVLGTFTPDMSFPSTACIVQDRLGVVAPAIEVEAACAGFMHAFVTASAFLVSGVATNALVIGADCNSRILNPEDPKTFTLFGDGAGAVVLSRGNEHQGLVSYSMGSDGLGADLLCRPSGGSRHPAEAWHLELGWQYMCMDGAAVFDWAVSILCDSVQDVIQDAGISVDDVDLFVFHQANIRILRAASDLLGIPRSKVFSNLEKYGNTSAGSVPLALDEAIQSGQIRPGQRIVLSGFGAGLAWCTAIVRW